MSTDEHPALTRAARPPDRTEVTGPAATDVHDVWEPPADRHARGVTVALLHGGFWRATYDRTHLAPLAEALADDGFHVANVEYARIGMPGGGWPGTGTSAAAGVAATATDSRLPGTTIVLGHSAGGQLALWLASVHGDLLGDALRGVLALAPVADLATAHRLGLSDHAVAELLALSPEADPPGPADPTAPAGGPVRWAADPGRLHVTVPTVVLTGGRDDVVPGAVTTAYRESRDPDEKVTFAEVATADHYDLIDPTHEAYFTLLAHLEELTLDLG